MKEKHPYLSRTAHLAQHLLLKERSADSPYSMMIAEYEET